jgi:hypothetical protein
VFFARGFAVANPGANLANLKQNKHVCLT